MAVVFHQPVHPVAIDHTGHEPIRTLELDIPLDELAQNVRQAGLGHGCPHNHTVAHPRACVASRAGLDGGTVAIDENVARRAAKAFDRAMGAGWHLPFDRGEELPPVGNGLISPVFCRLGDLIEKWHGDSHLELAAIRDAPNHHGRRQARFIVHRHKWRSLAARQKFKHAAFFK